MLKQAAMEGSAAAGRLAILTGSPGAVMSAVGEALGRAGWRTLAAPATSAGAVEAAMGCRAEAVVHLGLRSPAELDEGARGDLEAAAAAAAARLARAVGARRLVHVSSTSVYGRPRNLPCREGELKAPRTASERIRWRAEQASWTAFRRGAPLTVLRPALLYGPTLRGGPVRALALVTLLSRRARRVPIIRHGPVAHLCHLSDLARAVVLVASHPDDEAVVGQAFNVADLAPLPLAEILEPSLQALGYLPGRFLPAWPRLTSAALWLFRHVPDRVLLSQLNRRLLGRWRGGSGAHGATLVPRVDRESLHWLSADHYFDTSRLAALGFVPDYPVATEAIPETIRAMVAAKLLPGLAPDQVSAW